MKFEGKAIKYGDNVDTDVIIPARYLNTIDKKELASHCMEDIDKDFTAKVEVGDIMVAGFNFGCGSSREHAPIAIKERFLNATRLSTISPREIRLRLISTQALSTTERQARASRLSPSPSLYRK